MRDYEGTFDTAKGGTFEVSFKKGLKNTLQTMQILVKPAGYVDVSSDAWYYEAVNYVTAKCLMIGTDANVFSPNMNLTRGQMVTILYRMANSSRCGKGLRPSPMWRKAATLRMLWCGPIRMGLPRA